MAVTPWRMALRNAANAFIPTPSWNKVIGMRPKGSPVGLAVASDERDLDDG